MGFNLKDPVGSVRTGADTATEWYKGKMNPMDATDTEKNYYDNPNPFVDFEMSGTIQHTGSVVMHFVVAWLVTRPLSEAGVAEGFRVLIL